MMTRALGKWKGAVFVLGALLVSACSAEKDDAIKAGVEINALCEQKKNDEAAKMGAETYELNPVFKLAVDSSAATWRVKDVASFNYCGPSFKEARRLMAEHSETEGCGCYVVGTPSRNVGWLAFAGLGLLALRRRRR